MDECRSTEKKLIEAARREGIQNGDRIGGKQREAEKQQERKRGRSFVDSAVIDSSPRILASQCSRRKRQLEKRILFPR